MSDARKNMNLGMAINNQFIGFSCNQAFSYIFVYIPINAYIYIYNIYI